MGLFDQLIGNASEVDIEKLRKDYAKLLGPDEDLEQGYKVIRDTILFTNKRLIIVDVQGVTGKKIVYHSIPCHSIRHFLVETTGHFELEATLKIWIAGMGDEPIVKTFGEDDNVYQVQVLLTDHIAKV